MDKELIIYNCFKDGTHDFVVQKRIEELKEFARMLTKGRYEIFIETHSNKGRGLRRAIELAEKRNAYLLTYNLLSLKPTEEAAMALLDELQEEMIFVVFVDDDAVVKTLTRNMGNDAE